MTIHTYKRDLIWNKASEFLIDWLRLYHNITQKTLFLLSGGSAVKLSIKLAEFIKSSELDFSFLTFGQVDERFRPGENNSTFNPSTSLRTSIQHSTFNKKDINAYQIKQTGLWDACEMKKIPYYLVSQEGIFDKSAEQYDKQMTDLFADYTYKIAVLGIGEDGHTAGLLPGYQNVWNKNQFAVGYENNGKFPKRITLTPHALEKLDQAIVIAVGEKKKEAIKDVLNPIGSNNLDKYPATVLQKIKKADLFTDLTF